MRDPVLSVSVRRDPRLIELLPQDKAVKQRLARALVSWCATPEGRTDVRLHYRTGSSCGCRTMAYWTLEASMLDQYGPLPFTSQGKTIRWRWWHELFHSPSFTITAADLPDDPETV
jgi:hypothetical protein